MCFLPDPLDKPPDIRQLLRTVASVAYKWRLVGIELGLEEEQLDLISKEENPIICFSKVFGQWKKKKADTDFPFTWRTIASALRSPIVEACNLAMEIEDSLRTS